jgi:HEAT repeat protein
VTAAVSDAVTRAAELAALGFAGTLGTKQLERLVRAQADDPDPRVRAAALAALVRAARDDALSAWQRATSDPDAAVRRRAAELAPVLASEIAPAHGSAAAVDALVALLSDRDVTVVEASAWALGELGDGAIAAGAVTVLATTTRMHRDPLAREAAVAALGALADPGGLDAILHACNDRPAVRRRAVLALASFSGPAVDAAIAAAREDHDWQVRQAAEDLTDQS